MPDLTREEVEGMLALREKLPPGPVTIDREDLDSGYIRHNLTVWDGSTSDAEIVGRNDITIGGDDLDQNPIPMLRFVVVSLDDLPRLARNWLEMEARCGRLLELGMSACVLGDAMNNDQWVAAWARHREAMRACESHGDLEE